MTGWCGRAFILCRQHPWFTVHLPRYLAVMQADTVASATSVDDDIVSEVHSCCARRRRGALIIQLDRLSSYCEYKAAKVH